MLAFQCHWNGLNWVFVAQDIVQTLKQGQNNQNAGKLNQNPTKIQSKENDLNQIN